MSVATNVISEISRGPCQALLKPRGFRRSAPHFWRTSDGLVHCVNFQASAWGSRESGRFTINLGVSSPELFEGFIGRKFPKRPGAVLWPVHVRVGALMPGHNDLWWDIDEHTDSVAIGREVVDVLRDHVLPFFDSVSTRAQLGLAVRESGARIGVFPAQVPLVLAILAAADGEAQHAKAILRASLQDSRGQPFEETVRRVVNRLAISLEGA
jgi:hypothetical protein